MYIFVFFFTQCRRASPDTETFLFSSSPVPNVRKKENITRKEGWEDGTPPTI